MCTIELIMVASWARIMEMFDWIFVTGYQKDSHHQGLTFAIPGWRIKTEPPTSTTVWILQLLEKYSALKFYSHSKEQVKYILDLARGSASYRRLGRHSVPRPEITAQSGCHTHFKILLDVLNPLPPTKIFSSNLDELENWSSWEVGKGEVPPSPPRRTAPGSNFSPLKLACDCNFGVKHSPQLCVSLSVRPMISCLKQLA